MSHRDVRMPTQERIAERVRVLAEEIAALPQRDGEAQQLLERLSAQLDRIDVALTQFRETGHSPGKEYDSSSQWYQ